MDAQKIVECAANDKFPLHNVSTKPEDSEYVIVVFLTKVFKNYGEEDFTMNVNRHKTDLHYQERDVKRVERNDSVGCDTLCFTLSLLVIPLILLDSMRDDTMRPKDISISF